MTRHTASVAAAGAIALLLWTPVAGADVPPDCDQLQGAQKDQCQQDTAAGIANRAVDEAKQGADQAKKATDQAKQGSDQGQKPVDLADKNCWLVNGVPTMWSPALFTTVGQTAEPCYSHFGLTPH